MDDAVTANNGGDFVDNGQDYSVSHIAEYAYDANGNLARDDNKGILSITYNNLNLPASITKTGGNRLEYIYDARGNKLRQLYYSNGTLTKTTDFVGNFVYENGLPAYNIYDEGRIVYYNNGGSFFGEIYLKDPPLALICNQCRYKLSLNVSL